MFDLCCGDRSAAAYKIVHRPKPISLTKEMDTAIKKLLWYAPNIDSFQAVKNELVQDSIYDAFSFTYLMRRMGMDEDRDVKWLEPNAAFDEADWTFFENKICCHCQKIIITRQKNLSKTNDLLRCLRNCIAHGHFAVVDDYIIGFNRQVTKSHPEGIKKAVIKLKPQLLLNALESLTAEYAKVLLVGFAFERVGYHVVREPAFPGFRFDLLIDKDQRQYAVEIKTFPGSTYVHPEQLNTFLTVSDRQLPGIERVLFIDTSKVTKDVRKLESETENFRIVDITQVKELLKDNPVDILAGS